MIARIAVLCSLLFFAQAFAADGDVAGFDDRRGTTLPDVAFVDDTGAPVHMSQYFDKPFYLAFAYHTCPQLCGLVLGHFATALRDVAGRAGQAFDVVVVSIDPNDTPARSRDARQRYAARYGSDGTGWHFLTGTKDEIGMLAHAAGFRFLFDPVASIFVHPAGVFYVDRGGLVRGHVEGDDFSGAALASAREASVSTWDRLCGALGVGNGVHSAAVIAALRLFAAALLLCGGGVFMWRAYRSGAAR